MLIKRLVIHLFWHALFDILMSALKQLIAECNSASAFAPPDKTMRLKVFLQNGTKLREKGTVRATCSARGVRRPPNLRILLGGEPVKTTSPTKVVEENGKEIAL